MNKNPFKQFMPKKSRFKTTRKIGDKIYRVWSRSGKPVMACNLAKREGNRLRDLGYSVRIQKRKNGCTVLIRKKRD